MPVTGFPLATSRPSCGLGSLAATLLVVTAMGCGSGEKTYSVRGNVRFEDRSPLRKGQVVFQGGNIRSDGDIQEDGSFRMGTYDSTDGVPAGKYVVFLGGDLFASLPATGAAAKPPGHDVSAGGVQLLVDPSMCGPDSGIEFEVEPNNRNTLEIVAKRPGAATRP